jgi:hypothetical protein
MRPLLVVCGLIAGGIGGCCLLYQAVTYKDAQGHPIGTWAGDGLRCPDCKGYLQWQRDHDYRCKACGRMARVQLVDGVAMCDGKPYHAR